MSDKTEPVSKKESKKRTQPPSSTPSPSAVTPKKLKSTEQHKIEQSRKVLEIVESKLPELPPTPGDYDNAINISGDPQPGPSSNAAVPPWAHELWSML